MNIIKLVGNKQQIHALNIIFNMNKKELFYVINDLVMNDPDIARYLINNYNWEYNRKKRNNKLNWIIEED